MEYPKPNMLYSWEEYQELEASSEERFEYHDGIIVAMAGGTNRHNEIVTNLVVSIKPKAKKSGCNYFSESIKLFRSNSDKYLYPDGMLTCNPLDKQTKNGVRSPLLVIEVVSKSSAQYDNSFKLKEYLKISSIQHYWIIQQDECFILHFHRYDQDEWSVRICDQMNDSLLLPETNSAVDVSEIYRGIEFGPEITYAEEQAAKYAAENPNN